MNEARERALRTVARYSDRMDAAAAVRADRIVRADEPHNMTALPERVGDEHYAGAFAKMLKDPTNGHLRCTPEEVAAVQAVAAVEAERAMVIGTDNARRSRPATCGGRRSASRCRSGRSRDPSVRSS